MLEQVLLAGLCPNVDMLIVDEAQDLSPLQIAVVEQWAERCSKVYVAGDDDQAIYQFQGGEPRWLLSLSRETEKVDVLRQSFRIPRRVHDIATAIISENRERVEKVYDSRDEAGFVI